MSDRGNLDGLLHKTQQGLSGTNLPKLNMCGKSIISLSKIAHQMWRYHPFSQRNKTTKREVRVEVGGEGGGLDKIRKRWVR